MAQVRGNWRNTLFEIIFEADTPAGKLFDIVLIVSIVISVIVVMLDSVAAVRQKLGNILIILEWMFTAMFTIEYLLRIVCVRNPLRYALSFFGLVDLLAVLPTYISLLFPGSHYLSVVRILRVIRVFRVLKLAYYVGEETRLVRALWGSRRKIFIFLLSVMTLVVVIGSVMYLIEGEENGFTSIPRSIYWAVVTLTTVGYGDLSPQTNIGQALAALVMILGYGIIAVPTGIVTAEMIYGQQQDITTQVCPGCTAEGHAPDARYCKSCGEKL